MKSLFVAILYCVLLASCAQQPVQPVTAAPSSATAVPASAPVTTTLNRTVDAAQRGATNPPIPPSEKVGQFGFSAEKTAAAANCKTDKQAKLTASGPGYESFIVPCPNGEALAVRCDFGHCRVLK